MLIFLLFLFFPLQKFAHCLSLLPKVRGDEGSWSLLMQKILISIHVLLNDTFEGLEEGISLLLIILTTESYFLNSGH